MSTPTVTREYYLPQAGSFSNLAIRESPIPPLQADEVLLKNHAVSLQFRDLMVAKGQYLADASSNLVPGSDMAGEVIAVGANVKSLKVGDRVCPNFTPLHIYGDHTPEMQAGSLGAGTTNGVLTEYKAFHPDSLVKIPDHLSYEEASTLPCAALTAYSALRGPVPVKAGDFVLVQGTGGVSTAGLQFAVASGATVIATSSSDEKLKIAHKLGAKHLINYKTTPDWDKEALKITNGRGVDHIIEVGGSGTFEKSINSVRYGGFIHVIGLVSGMGPLSIIGPCIMKAITVRGIYIGSVAQFKDMNRLIEANPETTKPLIDKVFAFKDAQQAYAHLESQKHVGKVVIKVSDN